MVGKEIGIVIGYNSLYFCEDGELSESGTMFYCYYCYYWLYVHALCCHRRRHSTAPNEAFESVHVAVCSILS